MHGQNINLPVSLSLCVCPSHFLSTRLQVRPFNPLILNPPTLTPFVGGKTIPRWRMAAFLKIDISPYLNEKSSNFDVILYTAADFELDERHVIKNEKVALDRLRVRQNVFLVWIGFLLLN